MERPHVVIPATGPAEVLVDRQHQPPSPERRCFWKIPATRRGSGHRGTGRSHHAKPCPKPADGGHEPNCSSTPRCCGGSSIPAAAYCMVSHPGSTLHHLPVTLTMGSHVCLKHRLPRFLVPTLSRSNLASAARRVGLPLLAPESTVPSGSQWPRAKADHRGESCRYGGAGQARATLLSRTRQGA